MIILSEILLLFFLPMAGLIFVVSCVTIVFFSFLFVLPLLGDRKWLVELIGWIRFDLRPVMMIDFQGDIVYSLAEIKSDGSLHAPVYYLINVGDTLLCANGMISPDSKSSYVYWWIPLRRDEQVSYYLINDQVPGINQILNLSRLERARLVSQLRHQTV